MRSLVNFVPSLDGVQLDDVCLKGRLDAVLGSLCALSMWFCYSFNVVVC